MSAHYVESLSSVPAVPKHEIPLWKIAHEKVVWESDWEKLRALVHATEEALFLRWQELGNGPEQTEERASMEATARDLLAIKIHKLGWTDPCR
jgi:hypothetical protein